MLPPHYWVFLKKLIAKEASEESDQSCKVVELALIFGVGEFVLVDFHAWVKLDHARKKLFDLGFVALKLAVFLVKVVNKPDRFLINVLRILVPSVLYDHRDIQLIAAEHF